MLDLAKIGGAIDKILGIDAKISKVFACVSALVKLGEAHRKILQKHYPDEMPPDLGESFEKILADDYGDKK